MLALSGEAAVIVISFNESTASFMATRKLNENFLNLRSPTFWILSSRSLPVYDCPGFRAPVSGMNSIMLPDNHLAVPLTDGVNVSTPSLRSVPAIASGMSEASSTRIVDLSETTPPV